MSLAVHGCLAALHIIVRVFPADIMRATRGTGSYHSILSVLLAEGRRLDALKIIRRVCRAGAMRATFVGDVYHTVLSMFLAEYCRLSALDVKGRPFHA